MKSKEKAEDSLIKVAGNHDSGIACILMLINFYGSYNSLENLRLLSGTNNLGCSLLGLIQASNKSGLAAKGIKTDLQSLPDFGRPVILTTVQKGQIQRYVVVFGTFGTSGETRFIVGDPILGLLHLTADEISEIWPSNICIDIEPAANSTATLPRLNKQSAFDLLKKNRSLLFAIYMLSATKHIISSLAIYLTFAQILTLSYSFPNITLFAVSIFGLIIIRMIIANIQARYTTLHSIAVNKELKEDLQSQFKRLPKAYLKSINKSELWFRFEEKLELIRQNTTTIVSTGIDITLVIPLVFILLSVISWQTSLYFIIISAGQIFLTKVIAGRIVKSRINLIEIANNNAIGFIKITKELDEIRANNKFDYFFSQLSQSHAFTQHANFDLGKALTNGKTCIIIFSAASLLISVQFMSASHLQPQVFGGIMILSFILAEYLYNCLETFYSMQLNDNLLNSIKNLNLPQKDNTRLTRLSTIHSLTVDNLQFSFPGNSKKILNEISFDINKGESLLITGNNGSGKSILSNLLTRQLSIPEPSILINKSIPIDQINGSDWINKTALVPQSPVIFDGTIYENIAFEDALHNPQKVYSFIEAFHLLPFIQSFPQHGLTYIGEIGIEISLHQKQIISLARALYKAPELLVIDNLNSCLDDYLDTLLNNMLSLIQTKCIIISLSTGPAFPSALTGKSYLLN